MLFERTDTAVPLTLVVDREGVGGIDGLAPTVALRRPTGAYLDWDDGIFKMFGWGTKYGSMALVERGHYQRAFNAAASPLLPGDTLVAEYRVDNGADVVGDAEEVLVCVDTFDAAATPSAVAAAVWDETLAAHAGAGTAGAALTSAAAPPPDVIVVSGRPPT